MKQWKCPLAKKKIKKAPSSGETVEVSTGSEKSNTDGPVYTTASILTRPGNNFTYVNN